LYIRKTVVSKNKNQWKKVRVGMYMIKYKEKYESMIIKNESEVKINLSG
jgi:hypothetical protein